jgi:Leucine-rich repeat (LRR) protein
MNRDTKTSRYPGVQPFDINDTIRFFGREEDIKTLCRTIEFEKLLVLHAKSGYGKSSIIKAGVIPYFSKKEAISRYGTIYFSLKEKNDNPINLLFNHPSLKSIPIDDVYHEIEKLCLTENLLWWEFKKRQNSVSNYCLFLDQFEDFFTDDFSHEIRENFMMNLADLLYIENSSEIIEKWKDLPDSIREYVVKPLVIRIVIIIRSDKISGLDRFKPILGEKINRRFELGPLSKSQAIHAIIKPAQLRDPLFNSPPFEYTESGLARIIEELTIKSDLRSINSEAIEAFQLQIICEYIENKVRREEVKDIDGNGLPDITEFEIPDMRELYKNYYQNKLNLIPDDLREKAQLLVEENLVAEDPVSGIGRRRSVDVRDFLNFELSDNLLSTLENTYLIRRELNTVGSYNYELSHDTLIAPVLEVKNRRLAEERQKREEEERIKSAEELRKANERAKQAEKNAKRTIRLRKIAENAKKEAQENLKKAEKIIDAFYFYDDKYALANKDKKFYFINKEGNEVLHLGRWDKAENFDENTGFAKVTSISKPDSVPSHRSDNSTQLGNKIDEISDSSLASKQSSDLTANSSKDTRNIDNRIDYLINEYGEKYRVCFELQDLNDDIRAIDLRGKQFDKFPAEIFKYTNLQVLIIDGEENKENNFKTISDEIANLEDLEYIYMGFCRIEDFPKIYNSKKKIKSLTLSSNKIDYIPDDFFIANPFLKFLNLNKNLLTVIPDNISKLKNIETLAIGGNPLNKISEELWNLQNLKTLALWETNLRYIPKQIKNLFKLEKLYLSKNDIGHIPLEFFCLKELVELDLGDNRIRTISKSIGKLAKLKKLNLTNNSDLSELPETIYNLSDIEEINLTNANLTVLSKSIYKLKKLRILALGGNSIMALPDKFWALKNLRELYLWGNNISNVSKKIIQLSELNQLHIGYNPIEELPMEIFELKKLLGLDICGMKLSQIPASICNLQNIEYLDLHDNFLTELPVQIGDLTRLKKVFLNQNKLKTLPESMQYLNTLQEVNLDDNNFDNLPACIFKFTSATHISIAKNKLSAITKSIKELENLQVLNLSGNKISEIPDEFYFLHNLIDLNLSNNSISVLSNKIQQLNNIKNLNLTLNPIESFPMGFEQLKKLRSLKLATNYSKDNFFHIDFKFNHFVDLETLFLFSPGNQIHGDLDFSNCKNLTRLALCFSKIPNLNFFISKLTFLFLARCNLKEIPTAIFNLKTLKDVYLSDNEIKSIPDSIGSLCELQTIKLDRNPLDSISISIFNINTLTEIHINSTNLSKANFMCLWADHSMKLLNKISNTKRRFEFIIEEILTELESYTAPSVFTFSKIEKYLTVFSNDREYFKLKLRYLDVLIKFKNWHKVYKYTKKIKLSYSSELSNDEKINIGVRELFAIILSKKYSEKYQNRVYQKIYYLISSKGELLPPEIYISTIWSKMITESWQYFILIDSIQKLQNVDRRIILESKFELLKGLSRIFEEENQGLESQKFMAVPLFLRIGKMLVSKFDPKEAQSMNGKFLNEDVPKMRDRIKDDFGFTLPGCRVSPDTGLTDFEYSIQINEIPIVSRTILPDHIFTPCSINELRKYSIDFDTFSSPYIGEEVYAVPAGQEGLMRANNLEYWTDIEYIALHIEAVLRSKLADFFGYSEALTLIKDSPALQELNDLLPDNKSKLLFSRLIRTLLKENSLVSGSSLISDLGIIVQIIKQFGNLQMEHLPEIIRQIRLYQKSKLSGNHKGVNRIYLPDEMEEMLKSSFYGNNGSVYFRPSPDNIFKLMKELKELSYLRKINRNSILIVKDPNIRPFVRRLIEHRFPPLMVMAEDELEDQMVN